jgi:hypothetical protein
MPARFDDVLPFFGDQVIAKGPLHPTEEVKEVCAWVYQPVGAGREEDAAATEMTTNRLNKDGPPANLASTAGVNWTLVMERISTASFQPGRAFAVAVALLLDTTTQKERVTWWGQPVEVVENQADVIAAKDAVEAAAAAAG